MASYPDNDTLFSQWLQNFIAVANNNLPALSMTAADITALQAIRTDLDAKVTADTSAKEAAAAASAARKTSRKTANMQASFRSKAIVANPGISNSLKEQLGLNVPSPKTVTPPVAPASVSVQPFANGINALSWGRAGNRPNTQYVIEAKRSQNGAWQIVDVTTKTKYDHIAQTPGRQVLYRVKAKRGDLVSGYSTGAVAYEDGAFPLDDSGITE